MVHQPGGVWTRNVAYRGGDYPDRALAEAVLAELRERYPSAGLVLRRWPDPKKLAEAIVGWMDAGNRWQSVICEGSDLTGALLAVEDQLNYGLLWPEKAAPHG